MTSNINFDSNCSRIKGILNVLDEGDEIRVTYDNGRHYHK